MIETIDTLGHLVQCLLGFVVGILSILSLRAEPKEQPFRRAKVWCAVFGFSISVLAVVTFFTGRSISEEKERQIKKLAAPRTWGELKDGVNIE